jgi:hypothetical protein
MALGLIALFWPVIQPLFSRKRPSSVTANPT